MFRRLTHFVAVNNRVYFMFKNLNALFKRSLNRAGISIHRKSVYLNDDVQIYRSLSHFNIDTVFDIGANIGQFATELRQAGYKGKIVSFEPLSVAYQQLIDRAACDPLWLIHSQSAIGHIDGEIEINVSARSTSSSLLNMLPAHTISAPDSKYIGKEKVPINRLDSIASIYLDNSKNYFIKIDTQGFEWQVLGGAVETLKHATGILCEVSLVSLYDGQRLWLDILERLNQEGFSLWAIQKAFVDESNGRQLQANAIFFRI